MTTSTLRSHGFALMRRVVPADFIKTALMTGAQCPSSKRVMSLGAYHTLSMQFKSIVQNALQLGHHLDLTGKRLEFAEWSQPYICFGHPTSDDPRPRPWTRDIPTEAPNIFEFIAPLHPFTAENGATEIHQRTHVYTSDPDELAKRAREPKVWCTMREGDLLAMNAAVLRCSKRNTMLVMPRWSVGGYFIVVPDSVTVFGPQNRAEGIDMSQYNGWLKV